MVLYGNNCCIKTTDFGADPFSFNKTIIHVLAIMASGIMGIGGWRRGILAKSSESVVWKQQRLADWMVAVVVGAMHSVVWEQRRLVVLVGGVWQVAARYSGAVA